MLLEQVSNICVPTPCRESHRRLAGRCPSVDISPMGDENVSNLKASFASREVQRPPAD
jgi:hypothetical protein